MDKQQYEQAKYCFDKAGLSLESTIAQAYLQQEAAITAEDFEGTAQRFESCAELSLDRAISKELLVASAMCYNRAGNHPQSAQHYHDTFEYTKCVLQYRKASMMEEALDVTRGHREDIDCVVVKNVCVYFLDLRQYEYVPISNSNSPILLLLTGSPRKARSGPILGSRGLYPVHEVTRPHDSPCDIPRVIGAIWRGCRGSSKPQPREQSSYALLARPGPELSRAWNQDPP